jgi:hypothetical protein
MASRKLTDQELETIQLRLTNAQRRVYVTVDREGTGSARRVRVFIAPEAGKIEDITPWLKHAGFRMDKRERAIVTGHGFSAAQHVTQALEVLTHMELKYDGSHG